MARRFRSRPSEVLRMDDGFAAYCFDEACCFILSQLDEGKRPFFGHSSAGNGRNIQKSVNSQTVEIMKNLGAEVIAFD